MAESALSGIHTGGPVSAISTPIGKMFASIVGEKGEKVKRTVVQAGHTTRLYAESALVGGVLGAIHAAHPQTGLDIVVKPAQPAKADPKTGVMGKPTNAVTIPADLAAAAVLGVTALALAGEGVEGVSADARNMGSAAMAVFSFRKGADLMSAKMRALKKPAGGTVPSLISLQKEATANMHGEYDAPSFGAEGGHRDPILMSAAAL